MVVESSVLFSAIDKAHWWPNGHGPARLAKSCLLVLCYACPRFKLLVIVLAQDSVYSYAVKTLITVSTLILLGLIVAYHSLEVQVSTLVYIYLFFLMLFISQSHLNAKRAHNYEPRQLPKWDPLAVMLLLRRVTL